MFTVKPERPIYNVPQTPPIQKPHGIPHPVAPTPPEIHLLPYEQLPKDSKAYEAYLRKVFEEYMKKYKRDYINVPGEREYRFSVFADNYHAMNEFAVSDKMSAKYSVTEFSDLNDDEYGRIMGFDPELLKGVKIPEEDTNKTLSNTGEIPEHYDEREENYVTRVKLQGDCAACWAFTTVAVIEGLCARRTKKLQEFSEQSLIDCDDTNFGCKGGTEPNVRSLREENTCFFFCWPKILNFLLFSFLILGNQTHCKTWWFGIGINISICICPNKMSF